MKPNISDRVKRLEPFMVMTLLERAKELERVGKKIIHFEIGEPDFNTPSRIIDASIKGIQEGATHYTHSLGMKELRDEIAFYKKKTRGIDINSEREIMVTAGSSPSFLITLSTLLNHGDEVIITDPGYPCYANFLNFLNANIRILPIYEEEKFDLNIENFKKLITSKTKLVILNSPANPTGQIISKENLKKIADLAIKHDFYVLSDEIYAELIYSGKIAPSISEIPEMKERTIVLDGFSKFWAMTGWRLGYIIAPEKILQQMNKINQNFFICAPSVSQMAGIEAFRCNAETEEMRSKYNKRKIYVEKRIGEIEGLSLKSPAGAFYAFTNIKEVTLNSKKFAWNLLEKAGVAATPGIAFGKNGEGYLRISYCTSMNSIEEGFDRIEKFINVGFN